MKALSDFDIKVSLSHYKTYATATALIIKDQITKTHFPEGEGKDGETKTVFQS